MIIDRKLDNRNIKRYWEVTGSSNTRNLNIDELYNNVRYQGTVSEFAKNHLQLFFANLI